MTDQQKKTEIPRSSEIETVRCIIQNRDGKILLLQKGKDSKAEDLFEFPGGKIDEIFGNVSTLSEQLEAVGKEIEQETSLNMFNQAPRKVDEFTYQFEAKGNLYSRRVHLFFINMIGGAEGVSINMTFNNEGESEDKHKNFMWVTKEELSNLKIEGKLSGNSQRFEQAFI